MKDFWNEVWPACIFGIVCLGLVVIPVIFFTTTSEEMLIKEARQLGRKECLKSKKEEWLTLDNKYKLTPEVQEAFRNAMKECREI